LEIAEDFLNLSESAPAGTDIGLAATVALAWLEG
jgi:hypothetical protein